MQGKGILTIMGKTCGRGRYFFCILLTGTSVNLLLAWEKTFFFFFIGVDLSQRGSCVLNLKVADGIQSTLAAVTVTRIVVPVILLTTVYWDEPGIWNTLFIVLSTICAVGIIILTLQTSKLKEISQGHSAIDVRFKLIPTLVPVPPHITASSSPAV